MQESANIVENLAKGPMPYLRHGAVLSTPIALRERNIAPLWLKHQTKKPAKNNWSHLPVPTIDDLIATYRHGYNLGVRLGHWSNPLPGYGLVAVDIDIKGGEDYNPTTSLDRNEAENAATWPIFAYDDSSNKRDKMAPRHLKSLLACQVTL